jgi:hypothetical protein
MWVERRQRLRRAEMSDRLYADADLRAAIIALLVQNGGRAEVSFEELGEATITQHLGDVAIGIERSADGVAYVLLPSERAQQRAAQEAP